MTGLECVRATVTAREQLSEHLVRVRVAGDELCAVPWGAQGPGPRADAYFKLLIPPQPGTLLDVDVSDMARWRREFMAAPREDTGWIRTYTVRDAATVELDGALVPELAVDVVLHDDPEHGMGPGATWGSTVREGDPVQMLLPSGDAPWWAVWDEARAAGQDVVLAGDETALPALASIVDGVERGVSLAVDRSAAAQPPRRLTVAVEVPADDDAAVATGPRALARAASSPEDRALRVTLDSGTELSWTWLPRGHQARNLALELWLWERLAERSRHSWQLAADQEPRDDLPFVWDTADSGGRGTYWFLAAESSCVKSMRRMCVSAGVPKKDISFMGYWRMGSATE
ncbi:siderophore-interacting protein [Kocuria varians]|uniref:Siderophore-interacting protein n=1 Tax=Kocuria varians TaxID=1272 RepID=A0A4Y4D281_KOCVA|nr:siderophore-interacting protein [Kocuria varians]GEC99305.1 siderophore-interacting protein [Kocuria varians]